MKDAQGIPGSMWEITDDATGRFAVDSIRVTPSLDGSWLAATDGIAIVLKEHGVPRDQAVLRRDGSAQLKPFPAVEKFLGDASLNQESHRVTVNCLRLARIQLALNSVNDGLTLVFAGPLDPIRIVGDHGIAVLAPMETHESWLRKFDSIVREYANDVLASSDVVAEMIS